MNEISPEAMDEINQMIFEGRKLAAIKRYKGLRGTTLLDSKAFIESLTVELKAASPERFTKQTGSGCASVIVLAFATMALLGIFFLNIA